TLPSGATGTARYALGWSGGFTRIRRQFNVPVAEMEGVQEPLARMASLAYITQATVYQTANLIDHGEKPAVPSAILKSQLTEFQRVLLSDAMDVHGGKAVTLGPRNYLGIGYSANPVAITVEGANIMTRNLMIFGQGAIRCHPFIVEEIEAANMDDPDQAAKKFDGVFYRHLAHTTRNAMRAFLHGLTKGWLETAPRQGDIQKYYRQLGRFSAAFAVMTDVTLLSVGGGLKARQRLSGRMADCLVHLYYATAVIKQWHEEGYPEDQRDLVEWCLETCLRDLQIAMREAIINYPVPALRWPLRLLVFPLGATGLNGPSDKLGARVAATIVDDTQVRQRISRGTFINPDPHDPLGRVLNAYKLANETADVRKRLHDAIRNRDEDELGGIDLLMGHQRKELVDWACAQGIVKADECPKLEEALTALYDVIRVDAFDADGLKELSDCARGKRRVVERSNSE
ncbi:MAG: DUF1974 domain-containing protein, partial [Alteromonadaceae bacterium]|nr:DUF1974 domain-containing protein [Alteromonadaceae bacterium]